ncbi:unnamed protein product [Rhizophagus irregularis]|uniref:Uncharacterized protein n=1 Tax=Rhizophagus irregularis TaxID=588596 RepID=A0A915ZC30_9GLOM|nr:unnamed protein product [Rhizophagus irregularis]CAB5370639.1 unnamed protein product [Rhizophagus irregularis]
MLISFVEIERIRRIENFAYSSDGSEESGDKKKIVYEKKRNRKLPKKKKLCTTERINNALFLRQILLQSIQNLK